MSFLRRFTATALVVSLFLSATGIASAQSVQAAAAATVATSTSNDTMAAGMLDGEMLAERTRTGGKLGMGLGIGVLTGVIGTGIGYFVVGPGPLSAEALQRSVGKSADCQLGMKTGWERKNRSKKRNAFLAGGLLGTAAFFVMVAAAGGE
jgi:hypothetical protein